MKTYIFTGLLSVFIFGNISCANRVETKSADENKVVTAAESTTEMVTLKAEDNAKENSIIYLNQASFKELVFDYEKNKEWSYNGTVPAILDFYADWCGPCRQIAPILLELQNEYGGKIQVYKVDTDKEKELAAVFGIRSLPTIVFIPVGGEPQAVMGGRPKADFEQMISQILKVDK